MAIPLPSPLVVGNVVKGVVKGVAFGQAVINTFYWGARAPGSPGATVPKIADLREKFLTRFRAGPVTRLTSDYVVIEYWLYNVDGVLRSGTAPNYTYAQQLIDAAVQLGDDNDDRGSIETDALPLLDAMSVRCIPLSLNRNTRRTIRFSPMPIADAQDEGQTWKEATRNAWIACVAPANWILSDAAWTVEFFPINFSTVQAQSLGNPAPGRDFSTAYSQIIEVQPRELIRSQVSRKPSNFGY